MVVEIAVLMLYGTTLVLLFVFTTRQVALANMWRVARSQPTIATSDRQVRAVLPSVTVQLPIYNERHVASRVIDAVAAIDYPRDRLGVQVLDDSTDCTTTIVDSTVARHRAEGLSISCIRRPTRVGYKAGALAEGLRHGTGELIAVFDADFVPASTVLTTLVAPFADPAVGAVQARWGYLNENRSVITRIQAFLLDLHFRLEQPARSAAGLFINFNGTAGIWRRAAIDDAGGWSARTITEDIDLSYRAQLRGWQLVYLNDCIVPCELPEDISALRTQQRRWIKGGAQNARLHVGRIMRSPLPRRTRGHAVHHLVAGSTYAVILAMLVLSVPLAAVKNTAITVEYQDMGLPFLLATAGLGWTCLVAQSPTSLRERLGFAAMMAGFMIFTMGLAVQNGSAALVGWCGREGGEFVRTPKAGATPWTRGSYVGRRLDPTSCPSCS